jgi:ribosome-associated toxin RatA of RatAB toxin-antitoxin module
MLLLATCSAHAEGSRAEPLIDIPFPTLQSVIADTQALADLARDQVVVLHHQPRRFKHPALPSEPIQVTQGFTLIHAPAAKVWSQLLNFGQYAQFMPQVLESQILDATQTQWTADYTLSFKMPLIHVKPKITMRYQRNAPHELREQRLAGDIRHSLGRWEVWPLDSRRTLLAYTTWSDPASASWVLKLVFAAQPDFARLAPVSASVLTLQSIRHQIEGRYLYRHTRNRRLPHRLEDNPEPETPLIPDLQAHSLSTLETLAKHGNVSLIAPLTYGTYQAQEVRHQTVTTLGLVNAPIERIRPVFTDLDRYPKHIDAIERIDALQTSDHLLSGLWELGFNFSIFRLGIEFQADGIWSQNQSRFDFDSPKGDFAYLTGRWQWHELESGHTLVQFSSAHDTGPNSPYLIRSVGQIPFNQMFAGIFIGSQLIEGQQLMLQTDLKSGQTVGQ